MKRTIAALLLVTVGTTANLAVAKPSVSSSQKSELSSAQEEASQRFQRGVKLYRDRSFDAALVEFNRAYEIAPDYRVLYNIAQVQVERGDYVGAVKAFRQYREEGGDSIEPSRIAEVQSEIGRLEGRIARLKIVSDVSGAEVLIDGDTAGTLPLAMVPVNAGVRRVSVRKKGFETDEQRLMLAGGEEKTIEVHLKRNVADSSSKSGAFADRSAAPGDAGSGWHPTTGFWVSLAATVVAGGSTAAFALVTHSDDNKFGNELDRFPGSRSAIDNARSNLKRDALITDVCAALTVVGIGSTFYFAATSSKKSKTEAKVGELKLQTGPSGMGYHGAGWQFGGQF
jgi:hypothetical protein